MVLNYNGVQKYTVTEFPFWLLYKPFVSSLAFCLFLSHPSRCEEGSLHCKLGRPSLDNGGPRNLETQVHWEALIPGNLFLSLSFFFFDPQRGMWGQVLARDH